MLLYEFLTRGKPGPIYPSWKRGKYKDTYNFPSCLIKDFEK